MLHYWIILDIIIKQCNNSDLKIGVSLVNHRLNNDLDASVKKKKKSVGTVIFVLLYTVLWTVIQGGVCVLEA